LLLPLYFQVKGVPHHAKAGNINNLLLKGGARGDFVVVFDCDMIPKPDFLMRTIPHFFRTRAGGRGWEQKNRVGFLQTPQVNLGKFPTSSHVASV
jgi:cellulose synthase (UDP-forming)